LAVAQRLQKLHQKLAENELDAILISCAENRRYLSGFTGSAGFLLISPKSAILATDFRYVEQAKQQALEFDITRIKGELTTWFPEVVSSLPIRRLGCEAGDISFTTYRQLAEVINSLQSPLQLVPTEGLVESLRAIKEAEESAQLMAAAQLADAAIEYISSIIHPGMKEKEIAWEIEKFLRQNGSESLPFDIIVASGPNSALPHAKGGERSISSGEPIIIDLGAKVAGYSSDLTRTICLGPADETLTKIYDLALEAQLIALDSLAVGMSGEEVDRLARRVIEQGGYDEAFGHGLGHGIGLAPHEKPRVGPNSTDILQEEMVFTIEPGIYLEGWGGVRIEDMLILKKGGPRVLTKATRSLTWGMK